MSRSSPTRRFWNDLLLPLATATFGCLMIGCAPATAQERSDVLRPDAADTDAGQPPGSDGDASDSRAPDTASPDVTRPPPPLLPPLPPVLPGPELSPIIEGPPMDQVTEPIALRERPKALVKVIIGLVALLALAYLAGHPAVQRQEQRFGVSQVITAGFPFVLLGLIARHPAVGILGDDVLAELSPLLRLGLGWIGFTVGFRLDARSLDRLPARPMVAVASLAGAPFSVVLAGTALLLLATSRFPLCQRD